MIFLSKMVQMKMGESYRLEREMMSRTHHLKSLKSTAFFVRVSRTVFFRAPRNHMNTMKVYNAYFPNGFRLASYRLE